MMKALPSDWTEDDSIICCQPWDDLSWHDPLAMKVRCSLCGVSICAFPVSVEKAESDPNFHLVCYPKCSGELAQGRIIRMGGRVKANESPWEVPS